MQRPPPPPMPPPPNGTSIGYHVNGGGGGGSRADPMRQTATVSVGGTSPAPTMTTTTTPAAPPHSRHGERTRRGQGFLSFLRCLLIDVPLFLVCGSFLAVNLLHSVYHEYYLPMFDRATRTDTDLMEEYTYYNRECTEYDLTTTSFGDLIAAAGTTNESSSAAAAVTARTEQMLRHGGIMIPQVLRPESVRRLRAYIVRRNAEATDEERYPVSQGLNRVSYGIDASEDPAVADAVAEITHHPVLRSTLAALLGDDDPASAEITAITGYVGCPDQVWHQDTKADGNAIKFARTYSHSYSFFVSLQDTTHDMGATDFCPGTHYCTNSLEAMCERNKMRLSDATPERSWRAGDGALLNQHVWHRGSAHTDPSAPERILFILSFVARPALGTADTRQLSRGTYFHQKWLMWGHTYRDLLDPMRSMRKPFSVLRCLRLWKPVQYNWGYDLVTATFMRFANEQLEDEDLPVRFAGRLDQIGFPSWLRGPILFEVSQREAWTTFLTETIENVRRFVKLVAALSVGAYALFVAIAAIVASFRTAYSGRAVLSSAARRFVTVNCLLVVVMWGLHYRVESSDWARRILSGKALMRAFPRPSTQRSQDLVGISSGPTTLPRRNDVLLGTRFDAGFLGSYDRWLDFHPGNVAFREVMGRVAPSYVAYAGSASQGALLTLVTKEVQSSNGGGGRLLLQDHSNGNWRVLTDVEVQVALHEELVSSSTERMKAVRKELDFMIADCRFGVMRGTSVARFGLARLRHLKSQIMRSKTPVISSRTSGGLRAKGFEPVRTWSYRLENGTSPLPSRSFNLTQEDRTLRPGSLVIVYFPYDEYYYPATITSVNYDDNTVSISYVSGETEEGVQLDRVVVRRPIVEGSSAMGCYQEGLEDCFLGTINQVHPSGFAQIRFDDGDVRWFSPSDYYLPPHPTMIESDV